MCSKLASAALCHSGMQIQCCRQLYLNLHPNEQPVRVSWIAELTHNYAKFFQFDKVWRSAFAKYFLLSVGCWKVSSSVGICCSASQKLFDLVKALRATCIPVLSFSLQRILFFLRLFFRQLRNRSDQVFGD